MNNSSIIFLSVFTIAIIYIIVTVNNLTLIIRRQAGSTIKSRQKYKIQAFAFNVICITIILFVYDYGIFTCKVNNAKTELKDTYITNYNNPKKICATVSFFPFTETICIPSSKE